MRLFALTVGRNERYRYLSPMLAHMKDVVDEHFFYDDQSDDGTDKLAGIAGCTVMHRPNIMASFKENEGLFRQDAWFGFESAMDPCIGDWVLVIDCDEALVSRTELSVREEVERVIALGSSAVNLDIPEVFGFDVDDGCPLVRLDRLWGTIHAPRLFAYRPGGDYSEGEYGVPAVPRYVMNTPWGAAPDLALMHFGYANIEDQATKYARYNGRTGHGDAHVQSILAQDKVLERWSYDYPAELRTAWIQSTSS